MLQKQMVNVPRLEQVKMDTAVSAAFAHDSGPVTKSLQAGGQLIY